MPDLSCNGSYKITFSRSCSWIAVNLRRRRWWKVLIRINWEVNPTERETALGKRKPPALGWKQGRLCQLWEQRGCGALHTAASHVSALPLVSACLLSGSTYTPQHFWIPADGGRSGSDRERWLQVSKRAISSLFWQALARINTGNTGKIISHCIWVLFAIERKESSSPAGMTWTCVCESQAGFEWLPGLPNRQLGLS